MSNQTLLTCTIFDWGILWISTTTPPTN